MIKKLLCWWLAAAASFAYCSEKPEPFVLGSIDMSRDSDGFRSEIYNVGGGEYLSDNFVDRIGYRHTESHYSADGFAARNSADTLFAYARIHAETNSDFGIEMTRAHLDTGNSQWLGSWQLSSQPTKLSNVELRYEENWIDSRNALSEGVSYSALTLAGDYQFTDRFNIAAVVGRLHFSDDNDRPLYRAKATYVVSETYGVNIYARGRQYRDSEPYTGNYFSPENYRDYLIGIGVRKRLPIVRGAFIGTIDWGKQTADDTTSPARTWQLRLESWIGQRFIYALNTGYNATAGVGGGDDYEYRYTSISGSLRF